MKNGVLSLFVLLTMKPVQKLDPPVEITPTEFTSASQPLESLQATSTLHEPDLSVD